MELNPNGQIQQNYDQMALMNVNKLQRETKETFELKSFNNWIKAVLIQTQTKQTCRLIEKELDLKIGSESKILHVLDIGCGRGQDIPKWKLTRLQYMVAVDFSEECIRSYEERWRNNHEPYRLFTLTQDFTHQSFYYDIQHSYYDIVSAQLCFHYMFSSEKALTNGLAAILSNLLVGGATDIAHTFGLSDLVIGLTVVAIGTSLPEIAASLAAAWRGEGDIAVGNVVGSNIANLLLILGIGAVLAPGGLPVAAVVGTRRQMDLPIMLVTAVACLPVALDGASIARWEGGLFVAYYLAYLAYLVLAAIKSPLLGRFTDAMVFFALPMSAVTLAVLLARGLRQELAREEPPSTRRLPRR